MRTRQQLRPAMQESNRAAYGASFLPPVAAQVPIPPRRTRTGYGKEVPASGTMIFLPAEPNVDHG
jgi:hypothetical protein